MTEPSRLISAYLDEHRGEMEAFLAELVRTPSDNPPGDCDPHAARAAGLLETLGFTVERHEVLDDLVRANGMISCTNLLVRRRFGDGGPTIALNAHGDVVPPGEGWTVDPYGAIIRDGWMYGRGIAVSKSDFATYAFALKALEAAGAPLVGAVELHLPTTRRRAGGSGRASSSARGSARPISRSAPASPTASSPRTTAASTSKWR
jgi:acetylornithine deacetylase/succinyl-diaminopimelate desuccinylase-like protein